MFYIFGHQENENYNHKTWLYTGRMANFFFNGKIMCVDVIKQLSLIFGGNTKWYNLFRNFWKF